MYSGGIAIWGAVPAVYDTTSLPMDRGIHVHARRKAGAKKVIDQTFRQVSVSVKTDLITQHQIAIGELDAIYHMVSRVFNKSIKFIECPFCNYPHLDRDWFSVHEHKRHLCHGCGKNFSDISIGIGNPSTALRDILEGTKKRHTVLSSEILEIHQRDYPGGIRIWGSNPAIVWTAKKSEQEGIHVHALNAKNKCEHDGTYRKVVIDGIKLDAEMVRYAMAYAAMPHISSRVVSINCPKCGKQHLDRGVLAITPHEIHDCEYCSKKFRAPGKLKKTIGNPMRKFKEELARSAVRAPQAHSLGLRTEMI